MLFYAAGIVAAVSATSMGIGVSRAHQTTDYLEQARIAIPFIRWGTSSSLVALLLSLFGKGYTRVVAVLILGLFLLWWLLIALSIY
jgi:hypothetical protein